MKAYVGIFKDGQLIEQIGGRFNMTDKQIPYINALVGLIDVKVSQKISEDELSNPGYYVAWDYEGRK